MEASSCLIRCCRSQNKLTPNKNKKTNKKQQLGVGYWFIDTATATQVYAGIFGDASWNAW